MGFYREVPAYIRSFFRRTVRSLPVSRRSREAARLLRDSRGLIAPFYKAMCEYSVENPKRVGMFIEAYRAKKVELISKLPGGALEEPILLCAVKDDLERVQAQVEYHRSIGVKCFAYIDNMSTDGTREWLSEQEDIILFSADEKFHATVKDTWRRQVMDILGFNRWYLVLDSDELFCYPGAEDVPIADYIAFLEKQGLRSAMAFLVDMYGEGTVFSGAAPVEAAVPTEVAMPTETAPLGAAPATPTAFIPAPLCSYNLFDTDTYRQVNRYRSRTIKGGPRARVFSGSRLGQYSCQLKKNPLIYATKEVICASHTNHPINANRSRGKPIAFLLHYKFLPQDMQKNTSITEDIKSGGLAYSEAYVIMMEAYKENPKLSFVFEGSQRLDSSLDLMKINICDREFLERWLRR